jgi:hypothetical protein
MPSGNVHRLRGAKVKIETLSRAVDGVAADPSLLDEHVLLALAMTVVSPCFPGGNAEQPEEAAGLKWKV